MSFVFIINFKAYEQGTGSQAVGLAQIMDKIANDTGKNLIAAVQPTDLHRVSSAVRIPVFSQHIDPYLPGSKTGWILPNSVKDAGATGTLISHSERQLSYDDVSLAVKSAKDSSLISVVCAPTPQDCKDISSLMPDYIAVEPPDLIGSGIPVSRARPEVIEESKKSAGQVPLLCGAGINNGEDVAKAADLGAGGVLVASAIVKSDNQKSALQDLVSTV